MIRIERTKLNRVLLIQPDSFEDHRGEYVETYNKNVLRGIHGDTETWKLISCPHGKFYLVVVNCDETSNSFGEWESFVLSDKNKKQVLIPPMFGNGHLILSDVAVFCYKQSTYYDPSKQFSYCWNDSKFNIWWPIKNPILSRRDEAGHFV